MCTHHAVKINHTKDFLHEKKATRKFPNLRYTQTASGMHTSATVCTVGQHAHLLLSTLHVLSVGFAVVLGTNNMSNAELVVQGIARVQFRVLLVQIPCINWGEQIHTS